MIDGTEEGAMTSGTVYMIDGIELRGCRPVALGEKIELPHFHRPTSRGWWEVIEVVYDYEKGRTRLAALWREEVHWPHRGTR